MSICLAFKWLVCLVFRWYSNTGPFGLQPFFTIWIPNWIGIQIPIVLDNEHLLIAATHCMTKKGKHIDLVEGARNMSWTNGPKNIKKRITSMSQIPIEPNLSPVQTRSMSEVGITAAQTIWKKTMTIHLLTRQNLKNEHLNSKQAWKQKICEFLLQILKFKILHVNPNKWFCKLFCIIVYNCVSFRNFLQLTNVNYP